MVDKHHARKWAGARRLRNVGGDRSSLMTAESYVLAGHASVKRHQFAPCLRQPWSSAVCGRRSQRTVFDSLRRTASTTAANWCSRAPPVADFVVKRRKVQ